MIGFKEFRYSMKVFIISLLTNLTLLTVLYYIFNIRQFPPKYGRDFWIITTLIAWSVTFFVKKDRVMRSGYSSFRKSVIIFSSMFCTFMIMLFSIDLLSLYDTKTKEIVNIEEVYAANSRGLTIRNFNVIRSPMIYSGIKSRKKPVSRYAQVVFVYPFQSKNHDVFYSLIFEKPIDQNADEENQKKQLDDFLVYTRDTIMKNYDFDKIKNFEYITKMSREYRDISDNYIQAFVIASVLGFSVSLIIFFVLYLFGKYYFKSIFQWLFFSLSVVSLWVSVFLWVYFKSGIF